MPQPISPHMGDAFSSACAALDEIESRLMRGDEIDPSELASVLKAAKVSLESIKKSEGAARQQYDRLFAHVARIDERLVRVERNRFFRLWNTVIASGAQRYRRFAQALFDSPLHPVFSRVFTKRTERAAEAYAQWVCTEQAQLPSFEEHRALSQSWSYRPVISVIMPLSHARIDRVEQAVQSVHGQSYSEWEICIAAEENAESRLCDPLHRWATTDPRVKYIVVPERTASSATSNAAAGLASGDYVALLDANDTLSPFALHNIVAALQSSGGDLIYSDEDRLDSAARRVQPIFKPDWSSELLASCMYPGRLLVIRRQLFNDVHGYRSEFEGAEDHDLVLRLADLPIAVKHVPKVLYHYGFDTGAYHANSQEATRRAIEDAILRRTGRAASTRNGPAPGSFHVQRPIRDETGFSVVICSRNSRLLERCLTSLEKTRRGLACELIVVHHQSGRPDPRMSRVLESFGCKVVPYGGRFNYALMNNLGAAKATQPYLLFVNDDVFARDSSDWPTALMGCLQEPGIGIVGALLLYPSGAIQHAGIVLGLADGAGHCGRFQFASDLWPWLTLTRNVSAVTGACMGVPAPVFRELGGFDVQFPLNYNDVDFCLRAREAGYEVVCAATSGLVHEECQTRPGATKLVERELFYSRWADKLASPDPFYSPSLDNTEQIALA